MSLFSRWFGGRESPRPHPPDAEQRDYTLDELSAFDGSDPDRPLLLAIRGFVYDVGRGRDFYGPGGPYGMFAGRDCTRALAKGAFDPELFTGNLDGLEQSELNQLDEWIELFDAKYRRIGRLLCGD